MTCEEIHHGYMLFLFGAAERDERGVIREALENHLSSGCPECGVTAARAQQLAAEMGLAVPAVEPPAGLREKILAAASAPIAPQTAATTSQPWKRWKAPAAASGSSRAVLAVRSSDGDWEKTDADGVQVKRLFVDAANDRVTMLVRMAPGASYPRHRHAGPEECYVLDGDLHLPDLVMRAGDYQRAEPESVHGIQSTEGGCLLFVVSSLHDEIIA